MRMLTTFGEESRAARFGDYLVTLKIPNTVEAGAGGYAVWVHDDDHLARAQQELAAFQANPDDPRYTSAGGEAESIRKQEQKRQRRLAEKHVDVRTAWSRSGIGRAPLTIVLIAACLVVALLTQLGKDLQPVGAALFLDYGRVFQGQVWRIVTPIFLHFGPIHLLFNMVWLIDLGGRLEHHRGTLWLAGFVLVTAIVSNTAEYFLSIGADTPGFIDWTIRHGGFGGMSGVVYGLFGYLWMRSRRAPWEGLGVAPHVVTLMLIWLVACMTGLLGPIANVAHVFGLLVGVAWGWMKRRAR
jgi:GlpG protein